MFAVLFVLILPSSWASLPFGNMIDMEIGEQLTEQLTLSHLHSIKSLDPETINSTISVGQF